MVTVGFHASHEQQAIATLGEMYPGRVWAALGAGEALNEHVMGDRWPDKPAFIETFGAKVLPELQGADR